MRSTDPRRLLMISTHGYVSARPELGLPDTGGQVVYILELAKHLASLGHEVDLLTRHFEDQPAVEPITAAVRLLRFPCGGRQFIPKETLVAHLDEWCECVERFIRASDRSYWLINSHYWDAGFAGRRLAGRLGIPHVHTPHSLGVWKQRAMDGAASDAEPDYNFRQRITEEQRVCAQADALIATTRQQAELLASDYGVDGDRLHEIPPGYDESRFYPVTGEERSKIRRRLGWDHPVVLALGRIAANKGFDLLIQAMPTVLSRTPNARLYLAIGSSQPIEPERAALDRLAEQARSAGVEKNVEFRGHIPDLELADWYRAADVFALSSRYEPFGMTAVEAMGCGTPCVVTSRGGLCPAIRQGIDAICADPLDPEGFGHSLSTVLRHEAVRRQLSECGAAKVQAGFTWSNVARQMVGAFAAAEAYAAGSDGHGGRRPSRRSVALT